MRPMLACSVVPLDEIRYPVYVSPKLDGIRCIISGGVALSRSLKPIPNLYVQQMLRGLPDGLDGELIVGKRTAPDVYNKTHRGVMTSSGEPAFTYYVFDRWDLLVCYEARWQGLLEQAYGPRVVLMAAWPASSADQLAHFEEKAVAEGYEGLIVRSPTAMYKHGRSTPKEQGMIKIKRYADSEAEITGFVELMHNHNEATADELGHTKRSSHKENKQAGNTLGALQVRDIHTGVDFEIGTGFTAQERAEIWQHRDELYSRRSENLVKYRYFPVGIKDRPRHPVFKGWRHIDDLAKEPLPKKG